MWWTGFLLIKKLYLREHSLPEAFSLGLQLLSQEYLHKTSPQQESKPAPTWSSSLTVWGPTTQCYSVYAAFPWLWLCPEPYHAQSASCEGSKECCYMEETCREDQSLRKVRAGRPRSQQGESSDFGQNSRGNGSPKIPSTGSPWCHLPEAFLRP